MTNEELAAIKARQLRDDFWRGTLSMQSPQMHDDRGALLADAPAAGALWLMRDGRPWRQSAVQHQHAATLARAGLEDLRWHDLRGTAASRMLAAGATDAQVAAITGHVLARGSALSAYLARSRDLAVAAYRAWDRAMRPAEIIQLRRK